MRVHFLSLDVEPPTRCEQSFPSTTFQSQNDDTKILSRG